MSEEDKKVLEARIESARKKERAEKRSKIEKKKKEFMSDFKKFITRGNVIDLAVAMVIGTAFNKIVSGLVNYIIMPLVGVITGGFSIVDWKWVVRPETETNSELAVQYGAFLQAIVDFLIIAFSVFVAVKVITKVKNKLNEKEAEKKKAEEAKKKADDLRSAESLRIAEEKKRQQEDEMRENIRKQTLILERIAETLSENK